MRPKRSGKDLPVRRITVDERLADDFVRILVSSLPDGVKEFGLEEMKWGGETEIYVGPDTYVEQMGIPRSKVEKYAWGDLKEGQVFLSGRFKIVGSAKSPKRFLAGLGQQRFMPIHDLARKETERIYTKLLKGGE